MERDARIELARKPWQGFRLPLHHARINSYMQISKVQEFLEKNLIEPPQLKPQPPSDTSLLSTTPEEIQKNIQRWREFNERIHVVV